MRLDLIVEATPTPHAGNSVKKATALINQTVRNTLDGIIEDPDALCAHLISGATNSKQYIVEDDAWQDTCIELLNPIDQAALQAEMNNSVTFIGSQLEKGAIFTEGILSGIGSLIKKTLMFIAKTVLTGVGIGAGIGASMLGGHGYGGYGRSNQNQNQQIQMNIAATNVAFVCDFLDRITPIVKAAAATPPTKQQTPPAQQQTPTKQQTPPTKPTTKSQSTKPPTSNPSAQAPITRTQAPANQAPAPAPGPMHTI